MKVEEIRAIIEAIDASSLTQFSYKKDGVTLKMKKGETHVQVVQTEAPVSSVTPIASEAIAPTPVVQQEVASTERVEETNSPEEDVVAEEGLVEVVSPMVGTFYAASSPDAPPYVKKGDVVDASTVVCIVEAMKLFNEIEAEVSGEIVDILVKDGQLVEFGQPLFLIRPN